MVFFVFPLNLYFFEFYKELVFSQGSKNAYIDTQTYINGREKITKSKIQFLIFQRLLLMTKYADNF